MTTVFATIVTGVLVFVVGQIFLKFFIAPVHELKKTISKVPHTFIKSAHIFSNADVVPNEKVSEAYDEIRSLASFLVSDLSLVPFYQKTSKVFGLPSEEKIRMASKELIGYANTITSTSDSKYEQLQLRRQKIYDYLNQHMPKEELVSEDLLREAIFGK